MNRVKRHRFAAVAALLLCPLLLGAVHADGADDLAAYLGGSDTEVHTLPAGEAITFAETAAIPGGLDKTIHLPEGSVLLFTGRVQVAQNATLTFEGEGTVRLAGGIENAGTLSIGCGFELSGGSGITNTGFLEVTERGALHVQPASAGPGLLSDGRIEVHGLVEVSGGSQPGLYHNGTGALSRIRVGSGGELRVTGDGNLAMRCAAVSYNANIEVTDGGTLTIENDAGTAMAFTDREQPFGLAAITVGEGGTLALWGTGGQAFDASGSSGTCIFIEAGGSVLVGSDTPVLPGEGLDYMAFFPGSYLLAAVDALPDLPGSAPEAYILIKPHVRDQSGAAPHSYTLLGSYPYGFVYVGDAPHYPLLPGETVTLAAEGYLSVDIEVAPTFAAGGSYNLTLGPGEPQGFRLNTLCVALAAAFALMAVFLLIGMRRKP